VEALEDRYLPSINIGPNVNISRALGNQNEQAIAMSPLIDPITGQHDLFAVSNDEGAPIPAFGLSAAFSRDGGVTWTRELIGGIAGTGPGSVPPACCDPEATFDQFGNLFLLYFDGTLAGADLLLSTDGGLTFTLLDQFTTAFDQPNMAVGPNSIWLSFTDGIGIQATGATVKGLGLANIGAFSAPVELPGSDFGNFGSIAVGPSGQVAVVYQNAGLFATSNDIRVNVNETGIGGTWSQSILVTETNVIGTDKSIPANSNSLGIDAEANLSWDLSGAIAGTSPSPFAGRLYMIYNDAPSSTSPDVNVFERFSDDGGITWSGRIRVNDFDNGVASHFLPSIVTDPVTGIVAAEWYDTRNDQGHFLPGDTNGIPNDDAQLFVSASFNGGLSWAPNVKASAGVSNAAASEPAPLGLRNLGYGDFQLSNAFFNGVFYPVWADNSNSTGDNPDGTLKRMDTYTAMVLISAAPSPTPTGLVLGPTSPTPTTTTTGPTNIVLGNSTGANSFANNLIGTASSHIAAAVSGDFNGDGRADIATLNSQTGQWSVNLTNGSASVWTTWNTGVHWTNIMVGDFTGNGRMDIIGRDPSSGNWWLAASTGSSFVNSLWGTWNPSATWVDVKVGDFNGDAKADIIGRNLQAGQWWVGQSTGSSFTNSLWATWNTAVNWVDVQVADFNGDGRADITARASQSGQWWTGLSTGQGFTTSLWAVWNPNVTWVDVSVGDFNGDGLPDIVGRMSQTGQWWVGSNTGSGFSAALWGTWSTAVTWVDVQVGDFNGDGLADITGRVLQSGQWWTATSNGSSFTNALWGVWNPAVTWVDVHVDNFNGDAIIGMALQTGQWWMATPTFSSSPPGTTSPPLSTTLGPTGTTPPPSTGPISNILGPT
jgi:hypothetical protein